MTTFADVVAQVREGRLQNFVRGGTLILELLPTAANICWGPREYARGNAVRTGTGGQRGASSLRAAGHERAHGLYDCRRNPASSRRPLGSTRRTCV
jgi:hypothetical protein